MEEEAPSKHAHTPFTEARFCETTTNHHITFRVTVTWLLSCFRRESTTSGVPCFKMNPRSYCIRTCAHAQNHPRVRCGSRERDADYHPRAERIDTMFLLRISPISEVKKPTPIVRIRTAPVSGDPRQVTQENGGGRHPLPSQSAASAVLYSPHCRKDFTACVSARSEPSQAQPTQFIIIRRDASPTHRDKATGGCSPPGRARPTRHNFHSSTP